MAPALLRASLRAVPRVPRPRMSVRWSSNGAFGSYLVSPAELAAALKTNGPDKSSSSPRVIPLCGSWFLPNDPQKRTGRQVFEQRRVPTARFFDLDEISDKESQYPHMLPTAEVFAKAMSNLGIRKEDTLVVYDTQELGIFSAPRVAWTFKVFDHPAVHVLNNFKLWVDQGFPTEVDPVKEDYEKTKYPVPNYQPDGVVNFRQIKSMAMDHGQPHAEKVQIVDARPEGRFNGTDPEPRPGISSGHIPGSKSVPLTAVLDPETKTFLPPEELRKVLEERGLDPDTPFISTCGTGVSAAALDAALAHAGFGRDDSRRVYDGSWTEYAQRIPENLIARK